MLQMRSFHMFRTLLRSGTTVHRNKSMQARVFSSWPLAGQKSASMTQEKRVSNDMTLTFLGTASSKPSPLRGVSCTALRFPSGNVWLFDVGESSQLQLEKSDIRPSKITKIFITHLHGDHAFGLPGVLCMLGMASVDSNQECNKRCIDIYGPEGTRDLIRAMLQLTESKIAVRHRIHEFKKMHGRKEHQIQAAPSFEYGERRGGQNLYPDKDDRYIVSDESCDATVVAACIKHTIPCVGFVVEEKMIDKVADIIKRNAEKLKEIYGISNEFKIAKTLKLLRPVEDFTFPDGTTVKASDILTMLEPRKIVILGDTCDASAIAPWAKGANVLVHESTNAWDPHEHHNEKYQYENEKMFNEEVIKHGHSTPQMAGNFAKMIGAKKLILTHFSARYYENFSFESAFEDMARSTSGLTGDGDVCAAQDFKCFPIVRH